MRVFHRLGFNSASEQIREIEALGVEIPDGIPSIGGGSLIVFEVAEDHPQWEQIEALVRKWKTPDFVRTQFTKKELRDTKWLSISAWHHDYRRKQVPGISGPPARWRDRRVPAGVHEWTSNHRHCFQEPRDSRNQVHHIRLSHVRTIKDT